MTLQSTLKVKQKSLVRTQAYFLLFPQLCTPYLWLTSLHPKSLLKILSNRESSQNSVVCFQGRILLRANSSWQLSISKDHFIFQSSNTCQKTPCNSLQVTSICPSFSEIEMQELPQCWSFRSVSASDEVSQWNYREKAPGLSIGLLIAPWW